MSDVTVPPPVFSRCLDFIADFTLLKGTALLPVLNIASKVEPQSIKHRNFNPPHVHVNTILLGGCLPLRVRMANISAAVVTSISDNVHPIL